MLLLIKLIFEGIFPHQGVSYPNITGFDASCFDGVYVTGDLNEADIERMSQGRVEQSKSADNSRLSLPNFNDE